MSRPAVVFLGSCVLGPVQDAFASVPSITTRFDIDGIIHGRPPMDPYVLARASAIILQDGMLAKAFLSGETQGGFRVREDACVIRVPNLTLAALWPLIRFDPRDRREVLSAYRLPQTDRLALDIMRRTSDPGERRARYFATDIRSVVDLDRLHEMHVAQMRESERTCDVKLADSILERFQKERLFYVTHHPTSVLLVTLAQRILRHPSFSALVGEASVREADTLVAESILRCEPFGHEEVPIHPQVARHFGLEWWRPDLTYRLDGRDLTFESWIDWYMSEELP